MKILALVTDAFGGYGGIAQYNKDFLTALSLTPGVEHIDILPRLAPDAASTIPQHIHQRRPVYNRSAYSFFSVLHAAKRPDLIFSGHIYHGPLAWRLARFFGTKLVSQLHGDEVWTPLSPRHRLPLQESDLVLCVSRDTREKYLQQKVNRDNALVLANTVGPEFRPGDRVCARARFGLKEERTILTVARLDGRSGYKGHDRIIPLLPGLRANGLDVVYLIAGEGEDRGRLEKLAKDLGVSTSVRFLGKVPKADLPDLYRAADLFALPSTGEGFGIAFLEAMACGTPAIGLSVGGAPDALEGLGVCVAEENFQTAFIDVLFSPRPDPVALSQAVHARFGFSAFRHRVENMVVRLSRSDKPD